MMLHSPVQEELRAMMVSVLQDRGARPQHDGLELNHRASLAEVGFDSLMIVTLFARLDERYALHLERANELPAPKTVDDLLRMCELLIELPQ